MTRTISLSLPDDLLQRVDARVRECGGDRSRAIQELIEKGFQEDKHTLPGITLADLLSRASGPSPADEMSDEEVAQFAEMEVSTYRAEKRNRAPR